MSLKSLKSEREIGNKIRFKKLQFLIADSVVQNRTSIHLSISEYMGSNDNLGNRQGLQFGFLISEIGAILKVIMK